MRKIIVSAWLPWTASCGARRTDRGSDQEALARLRIRTRSPLIDLRPIRPLVFWLRDYDNGRLSTQSTYKPSFREQPRALSFHERVKVAERRDHQASLSALDRDVMR